MIPCYFCGTSFDCDCIERMECDKAGNPGHALCGICKEHGTPMFRCLRFHPTPRYSGTAKEQELFDNLIRTMSRKRFNIDP